MKIIKNLNIVKEFSYKVVDVMNEDTFIYEIYDTNKGKYQQVLIYNGNIENSADYISFVKENKNYYIKKNYLIDKENSNIQNIIEELYKFNTNKKIIKGKFIFMYDNGYYTYNGLKKEHGYSKSYLGNVNSDIKIEFSSLKNLKFLKKDVIIVEYTDYTRIHKEALILNMKKELSGEIEFEHYEGDNILEYVDYENGRYNKKQISIK